MKLKKWIALFLIAVMTLTPLTGCDSSGGEDFSADGNDYTIQTNNPSDNNKEPTDDTEEPKDDTEEPKDDTEEPKDDTEEPKDDTEEPKDDTEEPKDDTEAPKDDSKEPGTDVSTLKADTSGTPVTFLMQNLRTTGNQTGNSPTERDPATNSAYNRNRRFKTMVQTHQPDVILCQEGTKAWINFFQTDEYFSKNYTLLYKWRSESQSVLESTPVLYKTDKYEELGSGHFWLSETPDVESPSYEAAPNVRICTWVKLKDKTTNAVFYAYTAHVDTGGETPAKSMQQFYDLFNEAGKDEYCFVGGDFNFKYESAEYQMAVNWEEVMCIQDVAQNLADDGLCEVSELKGSLTGGFSEGTSPDPNVGGAGQLDHLFAKHMPNMTIDYYGFDYTHYDYP
ncbi:MAG: hypothetical protein IJ407_02175, partial [Clostridia bacterium]|nr:hypothetical protein [Clostridia bacterium]